MAEGFEAYHVPQQSRRDKLRVVAQNNPDSNNTNNLQGFLPLYDPSFLSPDLIAHGHVHGQGHGQGQAFHHHHHHHHHNLSHGDNFNFSTKPTTVKQEGATLMGFLGGFVTGSSSSYSDPPSSLPTNSIPATIINNEQHQPFYCTPQGLQTLREFTQSYNSGDLVVFKQEQPPLMNQGLSLSLSSHQNNHSLELNSQKYVPSLHGTENVAAGGYVDKDVFRSAVPLGPFTGYASILKGSRFLKPAQQLLEEFCNGGREIYVEKVTADSSLMDCNMDGFNKAVIGDESGVEQRRKKSTLLSMLEEVYRRYRQYYQQMQAAVSSFEYVAGLSNAAPYANLALKAMSKHFRTLKDAITNQLQFASNGHGHTTSHDKDEASRLATINRGSHSQRFLENQPVWRPQRGLPERAVTVLKAWLFEHFLHPYPTDTDKIMLAKQTGLSRNQVSNWFINARVRLWKPMVEEIHTLETRQAQRTAQREEQNVSKQIDTAPAKAHMSEDPSTSNQRMHSIQSKANPNEFPDIPIGNEEPSSHSFNMSSHQGGGGVNIPGGGGVSLTLGLHQNNGIGLPEPLPLNAAQRFGMNIDGNDDQGFVVGGFEIQNRHNIGRDVIGGQLFHDFVG